jgi:hypothetical protein
MGNLTQGKTYVKGSQNSIQPQLASNIDTYKSKTKLATSTNIHSKSIFYLISFILRSFIVIYAFSIPFKCAKKTFKRRHY